MRVSVLKIILYKVVFCAIAILIVGCNQGQETIQTEETEIEATINKSEPADEFEYIEDAISEEISEDIMTEKLEEKTTAKTQIDEPQNDEFQNELLLGSDEFGSNEALMLHKIAVAEAGGESVESMALIIIVILNRTCNEEFPDSIEEVIFQRVNGVAQFSPIIDGNYDKAQPNEKSEQAMKMVLGGWNESQGALYFEACQYGEDAWHSTALEYLFEKDSIRYYK